jgi:prolyl-tRNA editing enzyme YbaK/EbsC (Cys-tRNA(Pro) deacylase)
MAKDNLPSTPALLTLRAAKVAFEPRRYKYVEKGGTRASAEALGVDEHAVIKTIVLETGDKQPLICLMHGD